MHRCEHLSFHAVACSRHVLWEHASFGICRLPQSGTVWLFIMLWESHHVVNCEAPCEATSDAPR